MAFTYAERLRTWRPAAACGLATLTAVLASTGSASAAECLAAPGAEAALQVTADCTDPLYNAGTFKVLSVSPPSASQPYTKVLAEFTGTPYQVNLYLPPKKVWEGRFFQHVYPLQPIDAAPADIAFALSSGGYMVNTNGTMRGNAGYRVDAAAAKLAKSYAAQFYGWVKPIRGYVWGGSGGSFQTLGAIENTTGVWDGAVPYVIADEGSFLNYQAHAALIELALKDKLPALADAVSPGGSGDPRALLDADQRAIFDEALRMGFPLRGFEFISYRINDVLAQGGKPGDTPPLVFMPYLLSDSVRTNDPGYVDDFWSKPGHEGTNPPPYMEAAKVDHFATIIKVTRNAAGVPTSITLDSAPRIGTTGPLGLENWLYAADGTTRLPGLLTGTRDAAPTEMQLAPDGDPALLKALAVGDKLRINNRMLLAMVFYHRHAIPTSPELYGYAQYRDAAGKPLYPQRTFSAARWSMLSTGGGGLQTGRFHGKAIVVGNLLDINAYPTNADRYAKRVLSALGERAYADNFRLWYNDNANHIDRAPDGPNASRLVTYVPELYQALRDVAAWVEKGLAPPPSSRYQVTDSQLSLPEQASARGGIQPVVHLTIAGGKSVQVAAGTNVTFKGAIELPRASERVVGTEWYFGDGPAAFSESPFSASPGGAATTASHVFKKSGTYFVTLRAKAHTQGAPAALPALENIDRVRVVVR